MQHAVRLSVVIVLFFSSLHSSAQSGKITGKVYDSQTGAVLSSATVQLIETKQTVSSDLNGSFAFSKLGNKEYSIVVNYVSYKTKTVTGIFIKDGTITSVDILLEKNSANLNEVVVKSKKTSKESASSLIVLQKNRASISDGISAEVIRKTPDRSASDVLKRVSGATIQEDKFAVIRGLSDRYNNALLNGGTLPSSESDRKAFAFDIFSANLLDNIVIAKTATPDLPGEFGGGIIMVNTKSLPDQNFQTLSIGSAYNSLTTFKEKITYAGGHSDMLSDKDVTVPIPDKLNFPKNFAGQEELAKNFKNNWGLSTGKFSPNLNFQYTIGKNFQRNQQDFAGFILSATYSHTNSFFTINRSVFENLSTNPADPSYKSSDFTNSIYSSRVLAGALANFGIKIDRNNIISFKNIYNINNDDRLIRREGQRDINPFDNTSILIRQNARVFSGNRFFSSQLEGQHFFPEDKVKLNWLAFYSNIKRTNPSRNDTYTYSDNSKSYVAQLGDGANDNDAGTIKTIDTDENIKGFQLDVSLPINISESFTNTIKTGSGYQIRQRTFNSRRLGFAPSTNFNYEIQNSPLDSLFAEEHMGANGFRLIDKTAPFDKYDGQTTNLSSFVMIDSRISKLFRLIWGTRVESFNMKLNSVKNDYSTPLHYDSYISSFLPSVNAVISITDKQNVRLSYSQTVNRPEFREIAPFLFYDYSTGFTVSGNDTLKTARITNYDVRYEIYPGKGQVFSVSGFYKKFRDPIENVYQENAVNPNLNYQNSPDATNIGVEAEIRLSLGSLVKNKGQFFNNLTIMANYAYINSKVVIPYSEERKVERRLQGQSPYIINTGILYTDEKNGFGWSAFANKSGARIFYGGNNYFPDLWENGRTTVDLQLYKTFFKKKLDVRLTAKDIFSPQLYFFEDKNNNKKLDTDKDNIVQANTFGKIFSINLTYKL